MEKYLILLIESLTRYTLKAQYHALELMYHIIQYYPKIILSHLNNIDICLLKITKEESLLDIIYSIYNIIYVNSQIDKRTLKIL